MTEIISTRASVIIHTKDGEPEAVSISNGHIKLYKLSEMNVAQFEDFFEVNKAQISSSN
jgi:hypothetical protein